MALCKLGFIMVQYGWKSELCNYVQLKCDILNFSIIYRTVFGTCKLGLLWISLADNLNSTQILEEVSHIKFEEYLWNCGWYTWRSPFMALCKPDFIMEQYGWKLNFLTNIHETFPYKIKKTKSILHYRPWCRITGMRHYFLTAKNTKECD
jgi:hypothetical protein